MYVYDTPENLFFESNPVGTKYQLKVYKDEYLQRRVICYYEAIFYGVDGLEISSKQRKYRVRWHPDVGYGAYRIYGKLPNGNPEQKCKWHYTDEYYPYYSEKYYLRFEILEIKILEIPQVFDNPCENEKCLPGIKCRLCERSGNYGNYDEHFGDIDIYSFDVSNMLNLMQYEMGFCEMSQQFNKKIYPETGTKFPDISNTNLPRKKRKSDNVYNGGLYMKKRKLGKCGNDKKK